MIKCFSSRFFLFLLLFCTVVSKPISAQPQINMKTLHITVPLSDKLSNRLEKYLAYAYEQIGYKVVFDKILPARARKMVDAGQLDGMMVAEKEIEQAFNHLVRVPVMLAKGSLMLYCNKDVDCQLSALDNPNHTVGVISGNSISSHFMQKKQAVTHGLKSDQLLGTMLTKGRLNYVLIVNEAHLGSLGNFDERLFKKVELYRTEGYHYLYMKHKLLLPNLTKALKLAIKKFGPLIEA